MFEAIHANGWRQGLIFPASSHESFLKLAPCALKPDDCCIVISQSCDIVCPNVDAEPYVEVVLAHKLEGDVDGNFTHAKNPRRLHFLIENCGSSVAYETHSNQRFILPKQFLANHSPEFSRRLSDHSLIELISWIVSRYQRQAFPDEFNRRISKVSSKLQRGLRGMNQLNSLYVALNSWDELAPTEPYKVFLLGTMTTEDFSQPKLRAKLEISLAQLASTLNGCNGIEISESHVQSEADVSLDMVRTLARWPLDYISLSGLEN